jgi:uncharacterized protein (DUF2141 family)
MNVSMAGKLYAFLFLMLLFCTGFRPSPVKLTILVKNVQPGKGSIVLALFNSPGGFLKKPVAQQVSKADKSTMEISFTLPEGRICCGYLPGRKR